MDTIIRADNLSKKYRRYASVAEGVKEVFHPLRKKYHQEFWALRDLTFEIKRGESVGIIGRNGSGKSTLLQVLCGILPPTSGQVEVRGKVAALLELGAGFHPRFTGRENIFLNGALMGLTRAETEARFEDVVSFADIGDFIDQPVRTYSSGMFVRLAFAAAINVNADILVVDEALGVGDEAFQRKCYARINALKEAGATIIFVSHSAGVIIDVCDRVLLFDHGELLMNGAPKTVVSRYHKLIYAPQEKLEKLRDEIRAQGMTATAGDEGEEAAAPATARPAHGPDESRPFFDPGLVPKSTVYYESRGAVIENPRITTLDGEQVNVLVMGEEYVYTYDVRFAEPAYCARFGMMIKTTTGVELGGIITHPRGDGVEHLEKGEVYSPEFRFRCDLLPGVYFLNSGVVGMVNGAEEYLHRGVDISLFRVQDEEGNRFAGFVNFSAEQAGRQ